jgi:hypothetical protein
MNTKLFNVDAKLPEPENTITIYSTQKEAEQRDKELESRRAGLSRIFAVKGNKSDLGDKLLLNEKSKSLFLYYASDSFLYQDENLFAREEKSFSERLPDDRTAREVAINFLKKNELLLSNATVSSVTHTTVAVTPANSKKTDEYNTEVHVNLNYSLDKMPVFGPGAKTRVSMTDEKTNSGVYHFWREVKPLSKPRPLIKPDLALEIFGKNFRFAQLKKDSDRVNIKKLELGYFAMSPTDIQNYLIPVYKITGIVSTEALPEYGFTNYVVAVKYTEADVKSMGHNIGNVKTLVF